MKHFVPIKILLEPPGCKEVQYDSDATNQSYSDKGFVENTATCNTRDKIYNLPHNIQVHWKQYGIQHYVAGTIYSSVGYILPSVMTSLSMADNNDSMWDKGKLSVILPRTKLAKDTIFVENKQSNLNALVNLLKNRHKGNNIWKIY